MFLKDLSAPHCSDHIWNMTAQEVLPIIAYLLFHSIFLLALLIHITYCLYLLSIISSVNHYFHPYPLSLALLSSFLHHLYSLSTCPQLFWRHLIFSSFLPSSPSYSSSFSFFFFFFFSSSSRLGGKGITGWWPFRTKRYTNYEKHEISVMHWSAAASCQLDQTHVRW